MKIEATENLIPAEKIGVRDSSPILIVNHVDPQIKHSIA
jgi:hypothetical protein